MSAVPQEIPFCKMNALGNSCIIFHDPKRENEYTADFCSQLLHPHLGLGADNLMVIGSREEGVYQVSGYNLDGSPVGLCANGMRCITLLLSSKYSQRLGLPEESGELRFNLDGIAVEGRVVEPDHSIVQITLEPPRFAAKEIPYTGEIRDERISVGEESLPFALCNVGNPHCVLFLEEAPSSAEVQSIGSQLEEDPRFPERTNVEFALPIDQQNLEVWIWERGVGSTLASGSGACAAAVTAVRRGLVGSPVEVRMPGGTLTVDWEPGGKIQVSAPCTVVSSGTYLKKQL